MFKLQAGPHIVLTHIEFKINISIIALKGSKLN